MRINNKYESEELNDISLKESISDYNKLIVFTVVFLLLLILIGFFVKYPEKIEGKASIISKGLINTVYSPNDGELEIIIDENNIVSEGELLAKIKNPANYEDLLILKNELNSFFINDLQTSVKKFKYNNKLKLGEIEKKYYDFVLALIEYRSLFEINLSSQKINNIRDKINRNSKRRLSEVEIKEIVQKKSSIINDNYIQDSILYTDEAIVKTNVDESKIQILSSKEQLLGIKKREQELQYKNEELNGDILLIIKEKKEKELSVSFSVKKSYFELKTAIDFWEQKYTIKAPVSGKIEFHQPFLTSSQYVKKNMPLFILLPKIENIRARGIMSADGYGKIKTKDTVLIKLNDYPYKEFGQLKGIVEHKSKVYHDSIYYVDISLPYELETNHGKQIQFSYNMSGQVEYYTNKRSVIQRIFSEIQNSVVNE